MASSKDEIQAEVSGSNLREGEDTQEESLPSLKEIWETIEKPVTYTMGVVRFLLPALDALWGFAKGFYNFCKNPKDYLYGYLYSVTKPTNDRLAKLTPATVGLGRVGATILTILFILTMAGAIASPIPGATAMTGLGWLAALKVLGINLGINHGYTAGARLVGGLIGSLIDYIKIKFFLSKKNDESTRTQEPNKPITYKPFATAAICIGLGGENAPAIAKECQRMIRKANKPQPPLQKDSQNDTSPCPDEGATHVYSSSREVSHTP